MQEEEEKIRKGSIIRHLRRLQPYLKDYWIRTSIICVGSLLYGLIRLVDPNIYKIFFDDVLLKIPAGNISAEAALWLTFKLCGIIFIVRIVTSLIFAYYSYLSMELSQRMEARMFRDAVAHLQSLDMTFHHTRNSGEILSRVERGIDATTNILHEKLFKFFLPSSINVACLTVIIFYQDWRLGMAATFFIPFHIYFALRKANPIFIEQNVINRLFEKTYHRIYEGILNIEAVTSFNASHHELYKFDEDRGQALTRQLKIARWWRLLGFSTSFFEVTGRVAVIVTGTLLVINRQSTPGEIVRFLAYTSMLYQPLLDLITTYLDMQIGLSKIERLSNLMSIKPRVYQLPGAHPMPPLKHSIEFRNVSFSYGERKNALSHINLTIQAGTKVAFVGPTGAGKSTLAKLILRYYDPTSGIIAADGVDMRTLDLESLHNQITIVPQQALLFSRSIQENIAYGKPDADQNDIQAAAMAANAHDFIVGKDDGYEAVIGEKGVKLSGGEQQRLSIARAVMTNASVIVLDEATSHLDSHAESLVQDALWKLMKEKTAIIIAHRLSTIKDADMIVVIDDGKIIAIGKHHQLLATCDLYKKLCSLQFSNFKEFLELS